MHRLYRAAFAAAFVLPLALAAQTTGVTSGKQVPRLVIRNATMVDGNGTPARGPVDIVIENGRIADIVTLDPVAMRRGDARRPAGDAQIDATGKFVLPGLINAHTHMQSNRSGQSMGGFEYYMLLELANGVKYGLAAYIWTSNLERAHTFAHAQAFVDDVVTVSEDDLALALLAVHEAHGVSLEGAGATGLAACLAGRLPALAGKRVLVALTGCNIDPANHARALRRARVLRGEMAAA